MAKQTAIKMKAKSVCGILLISAILLIFLPKKVSEIERLADQWEKMGGDAEVRTQLIQDGHPIGYISLASFGFQKKDQSNDKEIKVMLQIIAPEQVAREMIKLKIGPQLIDFSSRSTVDQLSKGLVYEDLVFHCGDFLPDEATKIEIYLNGVADVLFDEKTTENFKNLIIEVKSGSRNDFLYSAPIELK